MYMLMTIFGAGASYDSVDLSVMPSFGHDLSIGLYDRPPLTAQLFDERSDFIAAMNQWPQVAPIIPRLRRAVAVYGGSTVEEVLREIQEQADKYPRRLSHLMALEYYLAEILNNPTWKWIHAVGGSTNYVELIDKIEKAHDGESESSFVTFNYDFMLEQAFTSVYTRHFPGLDEYIPENKPALIKPHGSVDWVQCLPSGRDPGIPGNNPAAAIAFAPQLDFRGGEIIRRQDAGSQIWHPAIAIPVDRTKTFVCPDAHLERVAADLKKVTHLLVVGWRASEAHFLKLMDENLRKTPPIRLFIVDKGAGALAAEENLQLSLGRNRFEPIELYEDGFSAFVWQDRSDVWLSEVANALR
jgi:hypothetical protein